MATKYYVDAEGNYIGGFDGVDPPEGAIEVPEAPEDARQKWVNGAWGHDLEAAAAFKIAAIDRKRDEILKAGKLYAGLHVALLDKNGTDGPRADLSGMATYAMGVLLGLPGLSWPEDYQTGWIAVENERIPLPTPQDGLALAQACGEFFAAVVQCARDKKDACLTASDQTDLDAVTVDDGWPENTDPVE